MNQPPAALAVGEMLDGKYEIVREIGRGAMGVVYEALHVALGRRVAIKTLLDQVAPDSDLGARFEREARAASAIGHPNIVDVFDLGRTNDGLLFMVMELLAGQPLEAIIGRTPQLPVQLAVHIMTQVLSGLSAAHKNGIVHRDLKPDNIFILDGEERPSFVKIVDFGISKMVGPQGPQTGATSRFAGTMAGLVLGTPLYMSPEQAIGHPLDQRTDIYSAGVVLYEMLCGRTPVVGQSYPEIMTGILKGDFPPPRTLRPDISPALEATIVHALARHVDKRFPSASAMRVELAEGPSEPTPAPVVQPSQGPRGTLLGPSRGAGASSIILLEPEAPRRLADDDFGQLSTTADVAPLLTQQEVTTEDTDAPLPELARPRRATPSRDHGTMAPESSARGGTRRRSGVPPYVWLIVAGVIVAGGVAIAARYVLAKLGAPGAVHETARSLESPKVLLSVEPKDATVKIDHIPVTIGELPLDTGVPQAHSLSAAAPRRVTRRFLFTMTAGTQLHVRLGRTLGAPDPSDPPPLAAELAVGYPAEPRPWSEIDVAFARLGNYADCLAGVGNSRGRVPAEKVGVCRQRIALASAGSPAMPSLQAAAEAYLAALQGEKFEHATRLSLVFRAEFLAARARWQLEELAGLGKDDGSKPGWHMRRLALMGQAWQRARKASPGIGHVGEPQRARLDEYLQALKQDAHDNPRAWERLSGAGDFIQAADELVALAHGQAGKRATDATATDATRKLLTAFDALVLD